MPNFYDRRNVDDNWIGSKRGDVMSGNGGNDTIRGEGGDDRIYGGDGDDWLYGGDGNDLLNGQNGNDHVFGGAGNDYIGGGDGADVRTGGSGADMFEFAYSTDSNGLTGIDTIADFNPGEGDRIELGYLVNNQPIHLVSQPTGSSYEITLTYDGNGTTVLNVYLPGDTISDTTIYLTGNITSADGINGVI
jgi:Ca2+-binding RTX toxin-like protein